MKDESLVIGEELLDGLPVRSDEIGFRLEELFACSKCGRADRPGRAKCLYCGAELQNSAGTVDVKPNLGKLEDWETGWNVIARSAGSSDLAAALEAARFPSTESSFVRKIFELRTPLPIARVRTESEAAAIKRRLANHGLETTVVPDEKLAACRSPVRLRGIELNSHNLPLKPFNGGPAFDLSVNRLALIVPGTIVQNRAETVEKRKRRENKTVFESMSATEELVIDLYAKDDPGGWRAQFGFDFSCIGDQRTMFARENFRRLTGRLAEMALGAKVIDDYDLCRPLLDEIWEQQRRNESHGLQRSGFGRKELKSVAVKDNLEQFTKFSRLQWHLL